MNMSREDGESDEFGLRHLPGDVLEGVLQRVGGKAKRQAELVDQSLPAMARRRAWRHRHKLVVLDDEQLHVGPFAVDSARAASVARFLANRSAINHFAFVAADYWQLTEEAKQQGRAILAALTASPRVELQSLWLCTTATDLFDGTDELAAVIHRHSATLRQAAIGLDDGQREPAVRAALHACTGLHKLTAIGRSWPERYQWSGELKQLISGLSLTSLTLRSEKDCHVNLLGAFAPAPTLRELRLQGVGVSFADCADSSALHNVRLLESDQHWRGPGIFMYSYRHRSNLPLSDEPHMKLIFSRVLPNVQTLILDQDMSPVDFWAETQVLARAFFNRPGDDSLAVRLCVDEWKPDTVYAWRTRQLAVWQKAFADLRVERVDAAAAAAAAAAAEQGDEAASARPSVPEQFQLAAGSTVFVLRRPRESRWLLIALLAL